MRNFFFILLAIVSPFVISAEPSETPAGTPSIYPELVSGNWLTYKLTPCNVSPLPSGCTSSSDSVLMTGELNLKIRFSRGIPNVTRTNWMPQGTQQLFFVAPRFTFEGSGWGMIVRTRNSIPGFFCDARDEQGFQRCLSRFEGQVFEMVYSLTFTPVPRSFFGKYPLCVREIYLQASSTAGPTSSAEDYAGYEATCTLGGPGDLTPPGAGQESVCSLNSQNLNLSYSSSGLNVDGLRQSTNLTVTCTAGDAQNYQLKLTGSNTSQGRLNFGNGVSAQVSLNGTQVAANGAGISLNQLTSQTLPVSATLVGTASVPGVTNAYGVLVLEAL